MCAVMLRSDKVFHSVSHMHLNKPGSPDLAALTNEWVVATWNKGRSG